jgi:hypothetical protein
MKCGVRYELHVETLRLLDFYGGAADISPDAYFAVELTKDDQPSRTT